jgi:hypothetical protein
MQAHRNGVGPTLRQMLRDGLGLGGGGWGQQGQRRGAEQGRHGAPPARSRAERFEHVAKLMQVNLH